MKLRGLIVIITLLFVAFSCSNGKMETSSADTIPVEQVASDPSQILKDIPPPRDLYSSGKTKLIKTLHYRFEVENMNKSMEAIEAAIKKYPAYISGSKLRLENPIMENNLSIRVQSEYFQDLVKDIDQQAKFVNFRNITTEDVAKQFVDLDSRLKTKREVEARYIEILRKKAGTIEELLNAEQQIGELQEEIESTIGQLNYLKDQVSYSTINLEFYQTITQEVTAADTETRGDQFEEALVAGWNGIVSVMIAFAYIWPLFVIGISFGFYFLYLKKKRLAKAV